MSRQLARTYPDSASRALSAPYPVAGGSYSTSFAVDQNPMVEDGGWVQGLSTGLDWQNMQTVAGVAHITAFNDTFFDDSIALRTGINSSRHYAQATVYVAGGYSPANGHEIELFVGGTLTANKNTGYEVLFSLSSSFQIVRQQGSRGDFNTGLTVTSYNGGPAQPTNGMVCRVEYSNVGATVVIDVYQNGVRVAGLVDSDSVGSPTVPGRYISGQPGIAGFAHSGSGASLTGMGWSDFSCGTF